jgi:hypothetical protein
LQPEAKNLPVGLPVQELAGPLSRSLETSGSHRYYESMKNVEVVVGYRCSLSLGRLVAAQSSQLEPHSCINNFVSVTASR